MTAPFYSALHPAPERWTKAVLLEDYDGPETTWHCSHHVPAGSPVVVQWRADHERAMVYEVLWWGTRPLFSCRLEDLRKYVRSVKRETR